MGISESVRKMTIYSTKTCSSCKLLMNWLEKEKIHFTKKLIDQDEEAMKEFTSRSDGTLGVPFTIIEFESGTSVNISGFDKSKFKNSLDI